MTCGPQFIFLLLLMGSAYDANGNLTTVGTGSTPSLIYNYDAEDQLIRVVRTNAAKSEFTYDGLGRRRVRREFRWTNNNWQATGEVRYVYDGGVVLQERHFNTQLSTNSPQRTLTYTRGRDLSGGLHGAGGIGGLLGLTVKTGTNAAQHYYYLDDGRGNVTGLFDTNRNRVASYYYDPFGNLLWSGGALAEINPLRFNSKEYHALSGTYYYGRRYYDPNLQRWLNEDPLGEAGGINLYRFAGNAPVNRVDPWGLYVLDEDGFPVEGSYNGLGAYLYDEETRERHDEITAEAVLTLLEFGEEAAKEAAISACTGPLGHLGKLNKLRKFRKVREGLDKLDNVLDEIQDGLKLNKKKPPQGGTYKLVDEADEVAKTGRSNNLDRRRREHARDPRYEDLQFRVDRRTDDYPAQRGREQIIHDRYQPPLDKINPIDPTNPRREDYLEAGKQLK
jgi:RHS repeat-associated protein